MRRKNTQMSTGKDTEIELKINSMNNRNIANTSFIATGFSICTGYELIQCIVKSGKIIYSYDFYKDLEKIFYY